MIARLSRSSPRVVTSLLAVAAAVSLVAPPSAAVDTGQTRAFRYLMGTSTRVEVYGGDTATRQQAIDEAFAAIAAVDRVMSDYRDDSELSMVNRTAAERAVRVSAPLFAVLDAADVVARRSDGAFDVTSRPLAAVWGLTSDVPRVPTAAELSAIRHLVGFRHLLLDRTSQSVRFTERGMALDLDGVAKGFAVEVAAGSIRRRGLSGVIDAGSTQFMVGLPIGKHTWSVGIADPARPGELMGAINVPSGGVSFASGRGGVVAPPARGSVSPSFRRPLLDPRTLQPSTASLAAVVVSPDGTLSEALSRAAFVLGPDKGLALLDAFPPAWGVVVYRTPEGAITSSVSPAHRQAFHPSSRP